MRKRALIFGEYTRWTAQIFSRGPAQGTVDEQHMLKVGGFFSRAGHGTVCPDIGDLRRVTDVAGQSHTRLLNPDYVGRAGRRLCQRSPEDESVRVCDYTENEIEYRALHRLVLIDNTQVYVFIGHLCLCFTH